MNPPPPDPLELAKRAREHSRNGFLAAVESGQQVRRETERVREHVRRNHFGEDLAWLWQRGQA